MIWFGPDTEDATACQVLGKRVPAPVGAVCPFCEREIRPTDFGEMLSGTATYADGRVTPTRVAVHARCVP